LEGKKDMAMMTVQEAVHKVEEIHRRGMEEQERSSRPSIAEMFTHRSGRVAVYTGGVQRGIKACLHCSGMTGMGEIVVRHEDGREVAFGVELYHYAQAGHPITPEDVDGETLLAILADA
jgi:hypothetical protein